MKKFFTLFALLSVGLSASAQPYVLTRNDDEEFSETMIANVDGTYSLRKLFYLTNGNSEDPWFDPEFPDEPEYPDEPQGNDTEYVFWVGDICRASFWMGNTGGGRENGWYDLTFTFDPSIPVEYYEGPLTITVNERTSGSIIYLSDDATFGTYSLGYDPLEINYIEYTRSCKNVWGTLCLPFDFQPFYANQFKDVTYYELKSATDEALVFSPIDESTTFVNAGTPLVFKLKNSNSDLKVRAWDIYTLNSQASTGDVINGWKLNGTIEETTISNGWVMQNNQIFQIDPNETAFPIKPYRAWFENPGASGAPLRIEVDETEGLQFVEQEDGTVKVSYDLQGRKLDDARKGLMIENGKVIMVK